MKERFARLQMALMGLGVVVVIAGAAMAGTSAQSMDALLWQFAQMLVLVGAIGGWLLFSGWLIGELWSWAAWTLTRRRRAAKARRASPTA